jgi:DNA-directed RNA polymerase specialized sigma subunit
MSKADWLRAYEHLESELGREPNEEEIRDWLAGEVDHVYEMYKDDMDVQEQMYGQADDDTTWEE